jgi:hypothetical protein
MCRSGVLPTAHIGASLRRSPKNSTAGRIYCYSTFRSTGMSGTCEHSGEWAAGERASATRSAALACSRKRSTYKAWARLNYGNLARVASRLNRG